MSSSTNAPGVKRTTLHAIPIPQMPGWENRLVLLEFPPGCIGLPHTHPVIGGGYVISGDHISQWEGGEIEHYKTGDTFIDRAEDLHVRTDNTSQTEWLRIVVTYVIKTGEPNVVAAASK